MNKKNIAAFADQEIENIKQTVGDGQVVLGLSGGVDSSVVAVLINRAVGKQLTCIYVNHGLMRKNETEEVERVFRGQFDINLKCIDARERFLNKLKGVVDPEQKRKIIGAEFIRVFEEEALKLGQIDYLAQGTIYPDIVESGTEGNAVIKSHHNVGGLPETIKFKGLVEPLKSLYKNEVRELGEHLGLPAHMINRQPFPGPGLGVRIIGEITSMKISILQNADAIVREEIEKHSLNEDLWQYFAILTGMRSVGVKDESRTYDYTIALRFVKSEDAMTATWAKIPYDVLETISTRITTEVPGVNRVALDITSKPPATIEWE